MSELALIRWDAPGPYAVAFSTRRGGVSGAPFDTLNLGRLTDDDPERVGENRRRFCAEVGTDPELLSYGRQVHGAVVRRAGGAGEPGDGLWTDTPGQPLLVFTADCLPVAIVRSNGGPAGDRRRFTSAGAACSPGSSRMPSRRSTAARSRPRSARGSVRAATRSATRSPRRSASGSARRSSATDRLDLWTAAERALHAAGVADVHRTDLCTSCNPDLFFSHRRDAGRTGRQGMIAYVS